MVTLRRVHAGLHFLLAEEEERARIGAPVDAGELRAIDGSADALACRGFDQVNRGIFRTGGGNAERDQPAIGRWRKIVDRVRLAGFLLPIVRIDEQRFPPRRVAEVQLEGVVLRPAAREIDIAAGILTRGPDNRGSGIVELGDAAPHLRIAGNRFQRSLRLVGMGLDPCDDVRVLDVFQRAIGIVDNGSEESLGNVLRRKRWKRLRPRAKRRRSGKEGEGNAGDGHAQTPCSGNSPEAEAKRKSSSARACMRSRPRRSWCRRRRRLCAARHRQRHENDPRAASAARTCSRYNSTDDQPQRDKG